MGYDTEEGADDGADSKTMAQVSLSDTIYEGIFEKIVPSNIIDAFATSQFTAVMFFAIVFGAALSRELGQDGSKLMAILKEMDKVFQRVIRWIIFLTPFAVMSLVASAIGKQSDLGSMFANIVGGWGPPGDLYIHWTLRALDSVKSFYIPQAHRPSTSLCFCERIFGCHHSNIPQCG